MKHLQFGQRRQYRLLFGATTLAVSTALMIGGCGGSGGGGSTSSSGSAVTSRSAKVNVYITDGFKQDWSSVLVTLYKIEVSTDSGTTYTTLFDDTTGQSIDLASLGSAAQLLSTVTLPAGTITNVRVTLGDSASLTSATDGTTKTVTVDSTLPNVTVANNQATFTYQASTACPKGKTSDLVVDFNLAAFELISGKLQPSLGPGDPTAFSGKQKVAHLAGTVSNFVDGAGFDLTPDFMHGRKADSTTGSAPATIHITLSSSTTVNSTSGASVAITDGASVFVEGTPDTTTGDIAATVVTVRDSSTTPSADTTSPRNVQLIGAVTALGSDGTSFTITVRDGECLPVATATGGTVTVQTDSSTTFKDGKTASSLSAVAVGGYVAASGIFDPTTGILTAKTVGILPAAASSGQMWPGPMGGPHGGGGGSTHSTSGN